MTRCVPAVARKQPLLGLAPEAAPVGAQLFEQLRTEHDVAILAALAFVDVNHHPLAVDVADLEASRFTDEDIVVLQIGSAPLVVCMRADDPLAQLTEIRPAEIADRLRVFRDPESHPAAHKRLIEMLAECGVRPEISCAAATPADVQWMVRKGFGLALIDGQMKLKSSLTTRPVAGVTWTADTAFVHHCDADHLALPLLARHLRKGTAHKPRSLEQRKKGQRAVQLELLT